MLPASSSKPTTSPSNNLMVLAIKCCWGWCWEGQGPLSCMPTSPTMMGMWWQLEWSTDSLRGRSHGPVIQVMQCATIVIAYTMATMGDTNTHQQVCRWRQGQSCGWRWSWRRGWRRSAWEAASSPSTATSWASPIASSSPFSKCTTKATVCVGGLNDWINI